MNFNKEYYRTFFEKDAEKWISGAYKEGEYSYPVGIHRFRILNKFLANYDLSG